MFTLRLLLCSLLIALAIGISGCQKHAANEQAAPQASPAQEQPANAGAAKESTAEASPDQPSGLAELSVEDRTLAEKQRICPVSGELLGSMGKPIKTSVKGKTVFLCCPGCEQELKANPDKYLAKLKNLEENK